MSKRIIMPLPMTDFDPSESTISWKILTANGIELFFATENGCDARCDDIMLTGKGLGLLSFLFAANINERRAFNQMAA
jgi:protease I